MVDCTKYSEKAFLQLLRGNDKFVQVLANAQEWDEVVAVINSLDVKYTESQLDFVKQKKWN